MRKHFNILRSSLIRHGFVSEAHRISLLYILASYDSKWRRRIEHISGGKDYPFASWFPEGEERVFLNFEREPISPNADVEAALIDLGFSITDYLGGYAINAQGRVLKIGKILNKKIAEIRKALNLGEDPEYNKGLEEQLRGLEDAFSRFNTDPDRTSKGQTELSVVISQDPHDIAQSSFERNWNSCFNLSSGSNVDSVFCEVQTGGLVAYLIDRTDSEINNPLARILIRRFENKSGQSYAMPEDSVYGDNIEGFEETVSEWIDGKNQGIKPGFYSRKGGEYSDTFDEYEIISPKDLDESIKWLKKDIPEEPGFSTWEVSDNDYNTLGHAGFYQYDDPFSDEEDRYEWSPADNDGVKTFDNERDANYFLNILKNFGDPEEYTKIMLADEGLDIDIDNEEFWEKHREYTEDRFEFERRDRDLTSEYQNKALSNLMTNASKLTKNMILEIKIFLDEKYTGNDRWDYNRMSFYTRFPEYLSAEMFLNMRSSGSEEILRRLPEEKSSEFLNAAYKNLIEVVNVDSADIRIGFVDAKSKWRNSETAASNIKNNLFDSLIYFPDNYMPAVEYLEVFIEQVKNTDILTKPDKADVLSAVNNYITRHVSDVEIIKKFFKNIIGSYNKANLRGSRGVNLHTVSKAIYKLGESGKEFVPFFQDQLSNLDKYVKQYFEERNLPFIETIAASMKNKSENILLHYIDILNGVPESERHFIR